MRELEALRDRKFEDRTSRNSGQKPEKESVSSLTRFRCFCCGCLGTLFGTLLGPPTCSYCILLLL